MICMICIIYESMSSWHTTLPLVFMLQFQVKLAAAASVPPGFFRQGSLSGEPTQTIRSHCFSWVSTAGGKQISCFTMLSLAKHIVLNSKQPETKHGLHHFSHWFMFVSVIVLCFNLFIVFYHVLIVLSVSAYILKQETYIVWPFLDQVSLAEEVSISMGPISWLYLCQIICLT